MSDWLLIVVLSIATYRLTRLVVKDDFPPVLWFRDRLVGGWRPLTEKERETVHASAPQDRPGAKNRELSPDALLVGQVMDVDYGSGPVASRYVTRARWVPVWLADLLSCPWCASGWVALTVTTGAAFTVGVPAPVLVWPAVWGAGALLASRDWS